MQVIKSLNELAPTNLEPCKGCNGLGVVRDSVPVEHPDFGKLFPCPVCGRDFQQNKIDSLFELAGVPPRFHGWTLDGIKPEHRDKKHLALAVATMYMDKGYVIYKELPNYSPVVAKHYQEIPRADEKRRSVLLYGPCGVGKSGILTVVFQHMIRSGRSGIWLEYLDFVKEIQRGYSDGKSSERLDAAKTASIVMLDDLGAHSSRRGYETEDRSGIFWQFINHRHAKDLPTLMTSNLNLGDLTTYFSARIVARIKEMALVCAINGDDLREV